MEVTWGASEADLGALKPQLLQQSAQTSEGALVTGAKVSSLWSMCQFLEYQVTDTRSAVPCHLRSVSARPCVHPGVPVLFHVYVCVACMY